MQHEPATITAESIGRERRMSARFQYRRLTPSQLREEMGEIDMPPLAFARIFGVRPETMRKWLSGQGDIPPWVFVVLWLLRECPAGIAVARTAAANHILFDRQHPERGEYPYLTIPDDSAEDSE